MKENQVPDEKEQAGLGKVIYSVDESRREEQGEKKREERKDVEEADIESFPASDPPGFTGSSSSEGQ